MFSDKTKHRQDLTALCFILIHFGKKAYCDKHSAPFLSLKQPQERCRNRFTKIMTSPAIDDVTERLAQTKVAPQHELSFKGKGWKLNKAEDGEELKIPESGNNHTRSSHACRLVSLVSLSATWSSSRTVLLILALTGGLPVHLDLDNFSMTMILSVNFSPTESCWFKRS